MLKYGKDDPTDPRNHIKLEPEAEKCALEYYARGCTNTGVKRMSHIEESELFHNQNF